MTAEGLSERGTEPELREELVRCETSGAMPGRQSLIRLDGMGRDGTGRSEGRHPGFGAGDDFSSVR